MKLTKTQKGMLKIEEGVLNCLLKVGAGLGIKWSKAEDLVNNCQDVIDDCKNVVRYTDPNSKEYKEARKIMMNMMDIRDTLVKMAVKK